MADVHVELDEIQCYFDRLEDPRSTTNQKHPFVSVVVMSIMCVMAGSSGPTAIAEWAQSKEEFHLKTLDLPHGLPRKDVFRRVLALLNPAAFQACFVEWLGCLRSVDILSGKGDMIARPHDAKAKPLHCVEDSIQRCVNRKLRHQMVIPVLVT